MFGMSSKVLVKDMYPEGWVSVRNWKGSVSPNFFRNGSLRLKRFLTYCNEHEPDLAGLTPDQLIEKQLEALRQGRPYLILDAVERWVNSQAELRASSKKGYITALRSFFAYSRADLPLDKQSPQRQGAGE